MYHRRRSQMYTRRRPQHRLDSRWYDLYDLNQYARQRSQVQSQILAFQSQLQDTRQSIVNFGSMSGNAGQQSSINYNIQTSNTPWGYAEWDFYR